MITKQKRIILLIIIISLITSIIAISQRTRAIGNDCPSFVLDQDGDGHCTEGPVKICSGEEIPKLPLCEFGPQDDCNDLDPNIPGEAEICDYKDNDCDGLTDNVAGHQAYLGCAYLCPDIDGDGSVIGSGCSYSSVLSLQPGYLQRSVDPYTGRLELTSADPDCDDFDPSVNPTINYDECDAKDNDCDGLIDEGRGNVQYFDCDGKAKLYNPNAGFYIIPPTGNKRILAVYNNSNLYPVKTVVKIIPI